MSRKFLDKEGLEYYHGLVEEELSEVVTDLKSDISVLEPIATSSDVGKALIAKTVADGKVTEYEFGEAGGGGIEHGMPSGGTAGQVLKKASGTDYDAEWGAGGSAISGTAVVLTTANWANNAQTVTVTGITASNSVVVAPTPASINDYASAGIYCSTQGNGTLTFICDTVPSENITVNVMVIDGAGTATVTLAVADWSNNAQTVTVTGVTISNMIIVSPIPTSTEDYVGSGVYCSAQAANALTFTCETVPESAITVNVMIVG